MEKNNNLTILHLTTHAEECGIAKYQERFIEALNKVSPTVQNNIFEYSPNKIRYMAGQDYQEVLSHLKRGLEDADILHIQYELSFFKHSELSDAISLAHSMGKRVIVTVHTGPSALYVPARIGRSPRSLIAYPKRRNDERRYLATLVDPLKSADLVLVHNTGTKRDLESFGVPSEIIKIIRVPVYPIKPSIAKYPLKQRFTAFKDRDVVVGIVGFISPSKGVADAVKMLSFLPSSYKLAIIGGDHPSGVNTEYINQVCDLIVAHNLVDRVVITGYIESDTELNALVRECDVCVYPYDKRYYQYVSSAALNDALASGKPVVAYPTESFAEMNTDDTIVICKSANYFELANGVKSIDYKDYGARADAYSERYSYIREAEGLASIYYEIARR